MPGVGGLETEVVDHVPGLPRAGFQNHPPRGVLEGLLTPKCAGNKKPDDGVDFRFPPLKVRKPLVAPGVEYVKAVVATAE